jgi:hypothetical protein
MDYNEAMVEVLTTIYAQGDAASLDAEQWEFLARLHEQGRAEQLDSLGLGDLLYKGLVQPVSDGSSWTFALTAKGVGVLGYHPDSTRKKEKK